MCSSAPRSAERTSRSSCTPPRSQSWARCHSRRSGMRRRRSRRGARFGCGCSSSTNWPRAEIKSSRHEWPLEAAARPSDAGIALDDRTGRWRHAREQVGTDDRAAKDAGEGIEPEERRVGRDGYRSAVVDRIERKRRQAYEGVAEQRDPPGQCVPPGLLYLRLIERELRSVVGERAHVGPCADDRLTREAAWIGAEAAAGCSGLPAQRPPVEGD